MRLDRQAAARSQDQRQLSILSRNGWSQRNAFAFDGILKRFGEIFKTRQIDDIGKCTVVARFAKQRHLTSWNSAHETNINIAEWLCFAGRPGAEDNGVCGPFAQQPNEMHFFVVGELHLKLPELSECRDDIINLGGKLTQLAVNLLGHFFIVGMTREIS